MSEINPITRMYDDMIRILNTMIIKYTSKAEKYESLEVTSNANRYLSAYMRTDDFYSYIYDYDETDFKNAGIILDKATIEYYITDATDIPSYYHTQLLAAKRQRVIDEYVEMNEYYRLFNGVPPFTET